MSTAAATSAPGSAPGPVRAKPSRVAKFALWLFEAFGALIAFVAFENLVSLVAGIIASIVVGMLLVVVQVRRDKRVSPFTVYVASSVVVFGILGLYFQSDFFLKIEPAFGNAATGLFFLGTAYFKRPIIGEVLARQSGKTLGPRGTRYVQNLTILWGLFFFVRVLGNVALAYSDLTLDESLPLRLSLGWGSFIVLIVGENLYRWLRYGDKAFKDHPLDDFLEAPDPAPPEPLKHA